MSFDRRQFIRSVSVLTAGALITAEAEARRSAAPIPLQPITVELLDMYRGHWQFVEWHGQHLHLPQSVTAYAHHPVNAKKLEVKYLCCDPEYPRIGSHGEVKTAQLDASHPDIVVYKINEACFTCTIKLGNAAAGVSSCLIEELVLGPAESGDKYVEAIYIAADDRLYPIWLAPADTNHKPAIRITTDRVGHIFTAAEPVKVFISSMGVESAARAEVKLELCNYASKKIIWSKPLAVHSNMGQLYQAALSLPITEYGIFELTASADGEKVASIRICRIPAPNRIDPKSSAIGINLFQQQVWWYAFQAPMMAAAGVHWIRPWLAWENTWSIQQPEPDTWDTRALDASVRRMERFNMRYQCILFRAPKWAASGDDWGVPTGSHMKEWGNYVYRLVSQYKGRISDYEVWNEPDGMWMSDPNSAEQYMSMLRTSWVMAKKADPNCVIYGLSHAGYMDWLERVGKLGAAKYMDAATFHTYASPQQFPNEMHKRIEALHKYGINKYWLNEFGCPAYDFDPEYSKQFECSEAKQAAALVKNYAMALSFNPDMKAFWFCTLDPRNPANKPEWTGDAAIGIIYLGYIPKLAYAAIAAYAKLTDGKRCVGMVQHPKTGVVQVSYKDAVSVVWIEEGAQKQRIPAVQLGCLADEKITVRDIYANPIASGKANEIMIDLSQGPVYIDGSRQLTATAAAYSACQAKVNELLLESDVPVQVPLGVPASVRVDAASSLESTLELKVIHASDSTRLSVARRKLGDRQHGVITLVYHVHAPAFGLHRDVDISQNIDVTVNGGTNLIKDGSFSQNNLQAWVVDGKSGYMLDMSQYHSAAGSLKLTGPFQQRFVQFDLTPDGKRPLYIRFWTKTRQLSKCTISVNMAWFGDKGWISTSCIATNSADNGYAAHIPNSTQDWQQIDVVLKPPYMPDGTVKSAFFIDGTGDGSGEVWFDDVDVWQ